MKFRKLSQNSLRVLAYVDASHNNCDNNRSQVGHVVSIADSFNKCAILHYKSLKSRRVARSSMCGGTLSFLDAFDAAFLIVHELKRIMESKEQLQMLANNEQVLNFRTKLRYTTEKRLMFIIAAARGNPL